MKNAFTPGRLRWHYGLLAGMGGVIPVLGCLSLAVNVAVGGLFTALGAVLVFLGGLPLRSKL